MALLEEKLRGRRLILASHSPRRRELLKAAGIEFVLSNGYEVDEVYPASLPLEEVAAYLAGLKSSGYPEPLRIEDILLTADTIVLCEGEILGKPADMAGATRMLRRLSGRKHTVISGVVLRNFEHMRTFSVYTDVWFRELQNEEIDYYVDTYRPLDKAGAYGIQEWIGYVAIQKIEGSFYNVMGLPVQSLYAELEKFIDGAAGIETL